MTNVVGKMNVLGGRENERKIDITSCLKAGPSEASLCKKKTFARKSFE